MIELLKDFVDEQDLPYYDNFNFTEDISQEDVSLECIKKLQDIIMKQKHLIEKLCNAIQKLKKNISTYSIGVQTELQVKTYDSIEGATWENEHISVEEMVKEAAEDAMKQTGFVYESTSGLYYDYNTGYYYNAELGLYYDGNSGCYYSYDKVKNVFEFHSRVNFPERGESSSNADLPNCVSESKRRRNRKTKNTCQVDNVLEDDLTTRKKTKRGHDSEAEEGECSDDSNVRSDSDSEAELENSSNHLQDKPTKSFDMSAVVAKYESDEMNKAWPPCMRIIVKETKVKSLKVGTLFLLTYAGGTLGREGDHLVLIPDLNISKYHARFSFVTKDEKNEIGNYTLTDLGSRNGTFIDGKRLSSALQESDPYPVPHESTVRVGGTTLLCHVHAGRETCPDCEPGLLINANDEKRNAYVFEENMSEKRKNELKKLKKKFGFKISGENNLAVSNVEYKDRAELRRQTVGSQNDSFKTEVACITQPIKKSNKGFKMLAKMGWSEGETLGVKSEDAICEPILVEQRAEKVGLGYDGPILSEQSKADKKKRETWRKTQMRYQNLQSDDTK